MTSDYCISWTIQNTVQTEHLSLLVKKIAACLKFTVNPKMVHSQVTFAGLAAVTIIQTLKLHNEIHHAVQ